MVHDLTHRQVVELPGALQHDADPLPPRRVGVLGVDAEDAGLAGRAVPEPLEDLHGGRLARAVGPEEGEHLAAVHVEVDAVDGDMPPVPLV